MYFRIIRVWEQYTLKYFLRKNFRSLIRMLSMFVVLIIGAKIFRVYSSVRLVELEIILQTKISKFTVVVLVILALKYLLQFFFPN